MNKIIDLSKYNTVTNWAAVATQIDGVIIRVGYRGLSSNKLTKDDKFDEYIKAAVAAKVPVSVYFFSQAKTSTEGKEEADFVIDLIKNYTLSMPIFVDSEYSNKDKTGRADSLSKNERTNAILGFLEEIKAKGYKAGVYASDSWFKDNLDLSKINSYHIWVAKYSSVKPVYVSNYIGWQYTNNGSIGGIDGKVDVSYWYEEISSVTETATETTSSVKEYSTGEKVELINVNLYGNSSTSKIASKKTGTYYIWNNKVTNGRIRITNSKTNVGKAGSITGWINVNDIEGNKASTVTTEKTPTKKSFEAGEKVVLNNVNFYANSMTDKVATTKSGNYYIWSRSTANGRIRITNSKTNVGRVGYITAWINLSDIS